MRPPLSRRRMLRQCSAGFGSVALAALLARVGRAGISPATGATRALRVPVLAPKARSVIFCYMSGGVSHVDSFDPKPRLLKEAGQPMPVPVKRTQFNNNGTIMPSQWDFRPRGRSGLEISELFPHTAGMADDLCVVRSMTSKFNEHAQGNFFMHTGFPFLGYPSAGAWASYGLGTESDELPSYVVLRSGGSGVPHGGVGLFGNGFLPAVHQASVITADEGEPVRDIRPREAAGAQRRRLDFVGGLDRDFLREMGGDAHIEAAIQNYEMAWRMQSAVPGLCDLAGESTITKRLYGMEDADPKTAAYARQCLLARRLVERGVRFIELTSLAYNLGGGNGANPWDHHGQVKEGHGKMGHQVDQPIAGLLADLKARGLLDSTLVIWAGEFGRTPFSQGSNGRDHNPYGFSIWLAGGGVKGGHVHGATDDYGYQAVDGVASVYDLWATVLQLLGLDHSALTFRHGGRDLRLTDVHGNVMKEILA